MGIKAMAFGLALKFARAELEAHTKGKSEHEIAEWVRGLARKGILEIGDATLAKWVASLRKHLDEKIDKE